MKNCVETTKAKKILKKELLLRPKQFFHSVFDVLSTYIAIFDNINVIALIWVWYQSIQNNSSFVTTYQIKLCRFYNLLNSTFNAVPFLGRKQASAQLQMAPQMAPQMAQQLPLSVLFAKDSFINQKVTLIILNKINYISSIVINSIEVSKILDKQNYDVVIDAKSPQIIDSETSWQDLLKVFYVSKLNLSQLQCL